VNVNTGQEFDGSDSGARPDEAVSWGKIKMDATPVKVSSCLDYNYDVLINLMLIIYSCYYFKSVKLKF